MFTVYTSFYSILDKNHSWNSAEKLSHRQTAFILQHHGDIQCQELANNPESSPHPMQSGFMNAYLLPSVFVMPSRTSGTLDEFLPGGSRVGVRTQHVGCLDEQKGRLFYAVQRRRHVLFENLVLAVVDRLVTNLNRQNTSLLIL